MSEIKAHITDQDFIIIGEYDSAIKAEMIKSFLDSEQIESMITNEYMASIYPTGVIHTQVLIRRADYERAKALIESI